MPTVQGHGEKSGRCWEVFNIQHAAAGPFKSITEIREAMHDLLGARISLYFPDDVNKVVELLDKHFIVEKITPKGGTYYDLRRLQRHSKQQVRSSVRGYFEGKEAAKFEQTTSGYGAMHLLVSGQGNSGSSNNGTMEEAWKDYRVEVQVGTIIMHAWAEVEHDILYQEPDLDYKGSDEELYVRGEQERVLDLMNGIALSGEAALRQLQAIDNRRLELRAKKDGMLAEDKVELGYWLRKLSMEAGIMPPAQWHHIEELFQMLRRFKRLSWKSVRDLAAQPMPKIKQCPVLVDLLPYYLLLQLGKDGKPTTCHSGQEDTGNMAENTRHLAIRLMHSWNLAYHFGCNWEFAKSVKWGDNFVYPAFTDLIDILNPGNARYNSSKLSTLNAFCKRLLSPRVFDDLMDDSVLYLFPLGNEEEYRRTLPRTHEYVRLAIELPELTNIVMWPVPAGESECIGPIPPNILISDNIFIVYPKLFSTEFHRWLEEPLEDLCESSLRTATHLSFASSLSGMIPFTSPRKWPLLSEWRIYENSWHLRIMDLSQLEYGPMMKLAFQKMIPSWRTIVECIVSGSKGKPLSHMSGNE